MLKAGDIAKRRAEIEDLVSEGEHKQGFLRAIDFAREFAGRNDQRHEAVVFCGDYNSIRRKLRQRHLTEAQYLDHRRKLVMSMLELLDEIIDSIVLEKVV